jgi:hypothetical protein
VPARADHDGADLIYQLSGGSGAFSIHPSNGQITVSNSALLDFEARSSRWDDPADFELFITISDTADHAVETIRARVSLTDANEPPVFSPLAAVTLPERSPGGTHVATATASDPDRADFVTYAITAGNTGDAFAIHPATGVISVVGVLNHQATPSYTLTITASDQRAPANHTDVTLEVQLVPLPGGYDPGAITRTFFSSIAGNTVADLTGSPNFPLRPNSEVLRGSFDGGTGQGSTYGSTMRGWVIAPANGNYTFWISADDSASLLISSDADPQNATARASLSSPATPGVWDLEAGQQSAPITLEAGQVYYIEARHKQSSGGDHLQVAWQGPGMAAREIIPGKWLVPYRQAYAPWAPPQAFEVREDSAAGVKVGRVSFIEPNLNEEVVTYAITAGNEQENFTIHPLTGDIQVAADAELILGTTHVLTISATDDALPAATGSTTATIQVIRLDQSLHAWWKLDETSGTTAQDSSGNNRANTLSGGGTWINRAAANPALTLNGTDARLSGYETDALAGDTPFTVAAWILVPTSHDAEGVFMHHASGYTSGVDRSFKISITADGKVRFLIREDDANTPALTEQFDIITTQAIHDGTWHHVACVRDGATGRVFIDGVLQGTASGPILNLAAETFRSIGRDALLDSAHLEATLDDIRMYAEPLSVAQIERISSAPKIAIAQPMAGSAVIPPGVGILLDAAASDPDGPTPAITWSQAAGPGTVTFGPATGANTSARFATSGTYILRATANDGAEDVSAYFTVHAGNTAISPFEAFPYGASTTGSFGPIGPQVFSFQGRSSGISGGSTQDGFYMAGQTFAGDFDLRARVSATFDDGFGGPMGKAGLCVRAGTGGLPDEAAGFIGFNSLAHSGSWIRRAMPGAANVESLFPGMPLPHWCRMSRLGNTVEFWHSPDGATWTSRGTLTLAGEIRAGICWTSDTDTADGIAIFDNLTGFSLSNTGPRASAGAVTFAQTGLPVALSGQTTDDGLPAPASITASWQVISGPGTVDIAEPSVPATTATFDLPGIYQLRFIADDGALRTFDEVTIEVLPTPAVSVVATDALAAETGLESAVFTVQRTGHVSGVLTVSYTLSGTAVNGTDYATLAQSVAIPDGEASATVIVTPLADALVEGSETIVLQLLAGPYTIDDPSLAQASIRDSNHAPFFTTTPILVPAALENAAYAGESLAPRADDPNLADGDTLTFMKISGPSWLSIATDGALSGTPSTADLGLNVFSVRVTDAAGLMTDGTLQIPVAGPSTYSNWQLSEFGLQASDPQVAGDFADPDKDGRVNLLEYALDADPQVPDAVETQIEMADVSGVPHLRVTYLLNPLATDLTLLVEASADPTASAAWSDQDLLIEQQTPTRLTVRDTQGGTRTFMRLRVSR